MNNGFIKVAAATPTVKVADCKYNVTQISSLIVLAEGKGVDIIAFPELSVTGATCGDLFRHSLLLDVAERSIMSLLELTRHLNIITIVGVPLPYRGMLLNCALVIQQGKIISIVPKTYLAAKDGAWQKRWFASSKDINPSHVHYAGQEVLISNDPRIFRTSGGNSFAIEFSNALISPVSMSDRLALSGAELIFSLSAENTIVGKSRALMKVIAGQSANTHAGYVYCGCGFGESTTDDVFSGEAFIFENGHLLRRSQPFKMTNSMITEEIDCEKLRALRFGNPSFSDAQERLKDYELLEIVPDEEQTSHCFLPNSRPAIRHVRCFPPIVDRPAVLERPIDAHPFIPSSPHKKDDCAEILNIQTFGLIKRLTHTGLENVVIGVSGGLDSTLALLVCTRAFDILGYDFHNIHAVTMPGFGTTRHTKTNALELMKLLGVESSEIDITKSVSQHFIDIGHDATRQDTTFENAQARERTQILMDLANKCNALVIGTGDLSELALGWATYNGDHMSMYGLNAGIPKTLIAEIIRHSAMSETDDDELRRVLLDVIDTPISPELVSADENGDIRQKTEDLVGPYELHDFFLYYFVRYHFRPQKIYFLAKKAFVDVPKDAPDGISRPWQTYDEDTVKKWITVFFRRFFSQQFKRSCMPDGPQVSTIGLSPRGEWCMPSDAESRLWLDECESL